MFASPPPTLNHAAHRNPKCETIMLLRNPLFIRVASLVYLAKSSASETLYKHLKIRLQIPTLHAPCSVLLLPQLSAFKDFLLHFCLIFCRGSNGRCCCCRCCCRLGLATSSWRLDPHPPKLSLLLAAEAAAETAKSAKDLICKKAHSIYWRYVIKLGDLYSKIAY